jgi:hypothetical protein
LAAVSGTVHRPIAVCRTTSRARSDARSLTQPRGHARQEQLWSWTQVGGAEIVGCDSPDRQPGAAVQVESVSPDLDDAICPERAALGRDCRMRSGLWRADK